QILQAASSASLVECINLGIQAAQSPIIHILANGVLACDGWIDRATAHFKNPQVAAVAPVICDAADPQQILAAGIDCRAAARTINQQLPAELSDANATVCPLLQAAFYRKSALEAFGGLPTAVGDELADVDLALSLRTAGWQMHLEPASQVL